MHILLFLAVVAIPQDTVRLTYSEALERARAENGEYYRQRLEATNADIQMNQSRAQRYYPRVEANATTPQYISNLTAVRQSNGTEVYVPVERRALSAGLSVSQPLPTGGRLAIDADVVALQQPLLPTAQQYTGTTNIGFRLEQEFFGVNRSIRDYRLARESHARSVARIADQERGLARRVMQAYFGLVKARKQAELDSMTAQRDAQRLAQMRQRIQGEVVGEIDSLKFELERIRSSMSRTRSNQGVTRALSELNRVLGLPVTTEVIPDANIVVQAFQADVDAGLAQAYARRNDLLLAQMSVDNRHAAVRDARRTSPITVALSSNLGFNGSSRQAVVGRALSEAIRGPDRASNVSMKVAVPIFDRFEERNAVARALNSLRSAESDLVETRRDIEREVRLVAQRVSTAAAQLELAQLSVTITRRTLALQSDRYDQGLIASSELLIDQANYRQAEIALIDAQVEFLTVAEDWRRATGEPIAYAGALPANAPDAPDAPKAPKAPDAR
jgi:outer membrane protein